MQTFKEFQLIEANPISPVLFKNPKIKSAKSYLSGSKKNFSGAEKKAAETLDSVYTELQPTFKAVRKKFESVVKRGLPKGDKQKIKFWTQVKSLKSFKNKVITRGNAPDSIGDVVRGALLFETPEQVNKFIKDFRRKNSGIVAKYEFKGKGGDKELGYFGSHHLDLMIDGLVVELQIMTRKMWKFKNVAHDLYTKNRDKISHGIPISKKDSNLSKRIYALANKPKFQHEGFEAVFTNLVSTLTEEYMEDVGETLSE